MRKTALIFCMFITVSCFAQVTVPDDTSSIDKIVNATYEVISGPAGKRDWKRFKNLFDATGTMGYVYEDENLKAIYKKFTPDDYIKSNNDYFLKHDFVETEIARSENRLKGLAQVFSNYQYVSGETKKRGVNTFLLIYSNNRWYIESLVWQEETEVIVAPKK